MSTYVITCVVAWPLLTFVLAGRLNYLRRGPKLSTVAALAALCAPVWPLVAVVLYMAPRGDRARR